MKWVIKHSLLTCLILFNCSPDMVPVVENENLIQNLLKTQPENFADILKKKDEYQVQILYTQINRDSNNIPTFKSFEYNLDKNKYFYPASVVKLPTALMALEKISALNIEGLDKGSTMLIDSAYSGQESVHEDTTSASGLPSIAHYLKKIFLASDNDAFNRIYEFVGQEELNKKLEEKGYTDSRIITRLSVFLNEDENRHTNPIRFMAGDSIIYQQPMLFNQDRLNLKGTVLKGKGYMSNGQLVEGPMDFTKKNFIPLDEMQMMLRATMFPEFTGPKYTFDLTEKDYNFIYQYMSQYPHETEYPKYKGDEFDDGYSKLLMFGNEKKPLPKNVRIFNKYGQAYGYLIDNAYIIDTKNKVEFLLSAVIQTNKNEVYNDNNYEYDEVGFPFFKNLGRLIYDYELKRKRPNEPDLSKFMVSYDKVINLSDKLAPNLFQNYSHYHIPELDFQRIRRSDIEPFIDHLTNQKRFNVSKLGESVQGRDINLIKIGNGPKKVLLWSQMHGDEPTATRALFEIFNFLTSDDDLNAFKERILDGTTLYVIPMLNPDGAEVFQRRNALSIDLNRDALRLTSPEAKILKGVRDKYEPEFGFNLHDQSKHYNVYKTGKTASISFLSPAFNYDKDVNEGRGEAMKLIVSMNKALQEYIPGHVGRYDDAFEPRAFGDNIQKWGTNTILIESGGYPDDPEKKNLVKMNFIAILHALDEIASENYKSEPLENYYKIPDNDRKFFDLLIRNGKVIKNGKPYLMDIGIFRYERHNEEKKDIEVTSSIDDMGDLSTYYGYNEIDAGRLTITSGKIYPDTTLTAEDITQEAVMKWLKSGYSAVKLNPKMASSLASDFPVYIVSPDTKEMPEPDLGGHGPLILKRGDEVINAVIHGKVIKLNK